MLLSLAAGCIPYVVPPVTGNLGAVRTTEQGSRTGLHVDVGFSPMQVMRSELDRRWDATLSGSYDRIGTRDAWGLAVAGGPVFFPRPLRNPEARLRLLPQLVGRLTTDVSSLGVRVALERTTFEGAAPAGTGAYGEAAIGVYLESGYRSDEEYFFTAGLTLRIPILAGIACCIQ